MGLFTNIMVLSETNVHVSKYIVVIKYKAYYSQSRESNGLDDTTFGAFVSVF